MPDTVPTSEDGPHPPDALREVLDALPYAILIFDKDRRLVSANAAAMRAIPQGQGPREGSLNHLRPMFQFIDPATESALPDADNPLDRALRGETVEGAEYLLRRPGKSDSSWIEVSARPTRGPDGGIAGAVFAFRNIAERKKRELALDAADEVRRFINTENFAGIIRATVDGRILDCNDAILRMLGYESREELSAIRASQLYFDPADRDRMLGLLAAPRRLSEFEIHYRRRDGSSCWALVNVRLLDPSPGQVGGSVVAAVVDITERKRQEEILRQSEARFAAFMRHLPGVAFVKDESGKYVYYNDASAALFGLAPHDIVGRTDQQLWPAEIATAYRRNDAAVFEAKRPLEFVETVAQSDGNHVWLMYKFPIDMGMPGREAPVLLGGIGIDITERTILEEQLTQARKMEALGRLAGGVAHDFNNLLTVISGYGQLALEGVGTMSPGRLIGYLQEVINSTRRAAGLTGQLLAFSRRQVVQPRVLNLAELLRNMQRLLWRVIGEHVQLSVVCGREEIPIRADAHQMEQVIMNLAVNSRDAMPLGGNLNITCDLLAEPVTRHDATGRTVGGPFGVLLTVEDTGIGMDEPTRKRIFDPFFTSKGPGQGTGLGLSTVYGHVSEAGGAIEVESVQGEGTIFRLYFPAAAGAADAPRSSDGVGAPRGRETVLLVEDDANVRALAETLLKRLGYVVLAADSGSAALRIWEERTGRIDVLLTDVIMPHMSGGELAHKLREINPRLRVLFMSGYTDEMISSHGVLAGETQLIQKPFTAEALGRKLRDVLDS